MIFRNLGPLDRTVRSLSVSEVAENTANTLHNTAETLQFSAQPAWQYSVTERENTYTDVTMHI